MIDFPYPHCHRCSVIDKFSLRGFTKYSFYYPQITTIKILAAIMPCSVSSLCFDWVCHFDACRQNKQEDSNKCIWTSQRALSRKKSGLNWKKGRTTNRRNRRLGCMLTWGIKTRAACTADLFTSSSTIHCLTLHYLFPYSYTCHSLYHCFSDFSSRVPLSQNKNMYAYNYHYTCTCTRIAVTKQNMCTYHCQSIKHVHVSLGTANACIFLAGLPGCFAGWQVWSICGFSNLTL